MFLGEVHAKFVVELLEMDESNFEVFLSPLLELSEVVLLKLVYNCLGMSFEEITVLEVDQRITVGIITHLQHSF